MKSKIYDILITIVFYLAAVSCAEDPLYDPSYIGEGEAEVTAEVTFTPLYPALSRAVTGGTPGDAIRKSKISVSFSIMKRMNTSIISSMMNRRLKNRRLNPTMSNITKIALTARRLRQRRLQSKSRNFPMENITSMRWPMWPRSC